MRHSDIALRMLKARVKLLLDQPFFGQIIMHLELQPADDWCKTAATNGKYFWYNTDFINSLNDNELLFLHGHEVLHVVLDHLGRRAQRDEAIWNHAADALINYILVKAKIGSMPKVGIYDPRYTDAMSVEQIYDDLLRGGVPIRKPLDQHLDDAIMTQGEPIDGADRPLSPSTSPEELAEIRETMRSVIMQAQTSDPGRMPVGLRRLVERILASRINWRQMLASTLRSTIKHDYTYTRLSRRTWSSGLILPGADVTERVEVTAFIDGSGSTTSQMLSDFLRECRGIMRTFRDFELRVATFDTEVYNVEVFTPTNAHMIDQYEIFGGGGTRPSCCWDYLRTHRIKPDRLIVFTDGKVGNDWGEAGYADTLFIVHGDANAVAPHGRTVVYEPP
jgi:predicted metal-dependent peptidase